MDEVGTVPAFPDEPDTLVLHLRYTCAKCGSDQVTVDYSRPSLDPRYALGNCRTCTPARKAKAKGQDITKRDVAVLRIEP